MMSCVPEKVKARGKLSWVAAWTLEHSHRGRVSA